MPAIAQAPELAAVSATMTVRADQPGPKVDRQVFGQFAEHLGHGIYEGVWVGRNSKIPNVNGYRRDVLEALKAINVPVIRWPGGCFADEYHWREGVGPAAKRPVKINTHWGGVTEPNSFGTHEFMNYSELVGAEAYVSGNVGNAPPRELAEWVEYITSPAGSLADERAKNGRKQPWALPYVGIGNELWGCGGNMRADYAADVTKRYATFVKVPAGTHTLKFASGANSDDYQWTETLVREASRQIDGLTLHYYTFPGSWEHKGPATGFDEAAWAGTLANTLRMEELISKHAAIMDKYDPGKRLWLVVDEWGTWYDPDPGTNPGFLRQQNSLRDALVAAINFNIFVKHADRVKMTAIAQMVNVLQAMILTDGAKMVRTPTYWVFDLYKPYQDATSLPITLTSPWYNKDQYVMPAVSASAVRDTGGKVHVSLANLDPGKPATVTAALSGVTASAVTGRIITAPAIDSINSFERPDTVVPRAFSAAQLNGGTLTVTLPPRSVVMLDLN
ncbi:alpha-L-arabinofuranosidase C-terminal domain-containing protein [uncultured Sphingomonas sp.]|uniref:alpha-N-arabinofuranosidase n=1 Tax=uncultured Sphingomonas sp. TaxID=158754 RepID=UPI0025EA3EE9|nr:alpha-L-arabinofuranosidase C-terminal domain-containing protein [uncultured Sphingomonas sp.]